MNPTILRQLAALGIQEHSAPTALEWRTFLRELDGTLTATPSEALKARMRAMAGAVSQPLFALDESGCIAFTNDAALRMLEAERGAVLGTRVVQWFQTVDSAADVLLDQLPKPEFGPMPVRMRGTGPMVGSITARPVEGPGGIEGAVVTIGPRVRSNQDTIVERSLKGLFEHAADMCFIHRVDGAIIDANPRACQALGYPRAELLALSMEDVDDDFVNKSVREQLVESAIVTLEGMYRRRDGTFFPVEAKMARLDEGQLATVITIVRDVSARVNQEQRLRTLNQELRVARDEAVAANKAKSVFLANMSHELRTPLNAIIGYGELIQEDVEATGDATLVPDIQRIQTAANHLLAIINDILDLSKIEAGKMDVHLENVPVSELVHSVVDTIRPLAIRNQNKIDVDCPPDIGTIIGDITKIRQGLFNLLSNACKFTEGGHVELRVRRQTLERDWVIFRVKDTGIGIPGDKLETLFDAFTQADPSTTRKYGGTGLGLAITRHFCRMMGGDIHARSEVGNGSIFAMKLPASVTEADLTGSHRAVVDAMTDSLPEITRAGVDIETLVAAAEASHIDTQEQDVEARDGVSVLVIDDDPDAHDILRRILMKEGYSVHGAFNGLEGIRLARLMQPNLITLDVMMPDMDGWQTLTLLKEDPLLADIPVVMLTMTNDRSRGFALGARDYLTKPVRRERLLEVLKRYKSDSLAPTVMVVEDDEPTREVLSRMLKREGWSVVEAGDGGLALDYLTSYHPDVILLDLMLPEVDGFEFLEKVSAQRDLRRIPIIVLTARDLNTEDRSRLQGRVAHILEKGRSGRDEILATIRDAIQR